MIKNDKKCKIMQKNVPLRNFERQGSDLIPFWSMALKTFGELLGKTSMRDCRPRSGSNTQKIPRGLRGRNQNRHRATARAIWHARTPQKVARAEKKCFRLRASDIPSAKWPRRYSQSDPTRSKSRDGSICKHKIGTAPQRDSKNQSSDRTLTPASQYEMRFFDVLWHKDCGCHEKMSPRHTKPCNCHAAWCQHSRCEFVDGFTKRAFGALQNRLQEHEILHLPRTLSTSNFDQPLRRFCTPLKTLTFCTFPDFRKSTRRAGENAPLKWTSSRPCFAKAKCKFTISKETFHREGCQICRRLRRTPPIYTRCFSLSVRTP